MVSVFSVSHSLSAMKVAQQFTAWRADDEDRTGKPARTTS